MIDRRILVLFAALALALPAGSAAAAGDAAKGEKVFKKCKACHSIQAGKNKVGPSLAGLVGRKAGSAPGYKYAAGLKDAGAKGLVWDEESLLAYLENPKKFLADYLGKKAKTKMPFRLKKEDQRADVIAYLKAKAK